MARVTVEFINTCPHCAGYEETVKAVADRFGDDVEVRIYHAGRDFDYLRKYGPVSKGTLIIDGHKKYDNLTSELIERVIIEAVSTPAP